MEQILAQAHLQELLQTVLRVHLVPRVLRAQQALQAAVAAAERY
jgi:hypothetical protein